MGSTPKSSEGWYENGENSLVPVLHEEEEPIKTLQQSRPPIVTSYHKHIRPLLDAVDKLRHLMIMKEGIHLPTIVVVGDQSSGKSSVLESLAGIHLPRGQDICTRVPLIMRLQDHPSLLPELWLEYGGKTVPTDEQTVADAIRLATDDIAGGGKGISNAPLTLVVRKNGVPDLTMVDLPGITRVPVHGQPEDIYEQISAMIMEYISPVESIILNVISATVDFPTCESIRMSQSVDKSGERTLAVVTKADKAPEGLLEKVMADEVNIGLGYVCVRNRIGDESYEDARKEETRLFQTHHLLSLMDKSMAGIPVLAEKLAQIQAGIIFRCLPGIVKKIDDKVTANAHELSKLPHNLFSAKEAMAAFMRIVGSAKESLRKILLTGEFEEYPDEKNMHGTARLAEKLKQFADHLREEESGEDFLMEEIRVLEEAKGIELPNFLPKSAFHSLLQKKVKEISTRPALFFTDAWSYTESAVVRVLMDRCDNYPQLQSLTKRAAHNLVEKMKALSMERAAEAVEMEKMTGYTCHPEYMTSWNRLMEKQSTFLSSVSSSLSMSIPYRVELQGFGAMEVKHLKEHRDLIREAFDMKMRMTAYWEIVLRRIVDNMALYLLFNVQNLVKDIDAEIVTELLVNSKEGAVRIEQLLEESPSVAARREKLNRSINLLKEAKDVVGKIMDKIPA